MTTSLALRVVAGLKDKIFTGFDNYGTILSSAAFWKVTGNTLIWTIASTVIAFALGLGAAAGEGVVPDHDARLAGELLDV